MSRNGLRRDLVHAEGFSKEKNNIEWNQNFTFFSMIRDLDSIRKDNLSFICG